VIHKVERSAEELLERFEVRKPPVNVQRVAERLNVSVRFEHLEPTVSGMLFRSQRSTVIAVNSDHADVRQRFTIAHEIGHLTLHQGRPVIVDHLVRARVNLRDTESSLATNREEIQANGFAAALLMPAEWIFEDVEERLQLSPRKMVADLADRYSVSAQAMELRLVNLGVRAAP
jgi:Zn-dependent peptidase ImmA (M78 family)